MAEIQKAQSFSDREMTWMGHPAEMLLFPSGDEKTSHVFGIGF